MSSSAALEARALKAERENERLVALVADIQAQRNDTARLLERISAQNVQLRGRHERAEARVAELSTYTRSAS